MNGSWFAVQLPETGKCTRMEVFAKLPEGAVQMALFLLAENFGPDDETLFNDVSVREIL